MHYRNRWWIMTGGESSTEIEISFIDRGGTMQLEIEHRGWGRLGDSGLYGRKANHAGWDGMLACFVAACSSSAPVLATQTAKEE